MNASEALDWSREARQYDAPHGRLRMLARLLRQQPRRRLLDVGCGPAHLRKLLPNDFEYHGCDITNLAANDLPPGHFLQVDFNRTTDLRLFAGRGIEVVCISGVLEYLREPGAVLTATRGLLGPEGLLVVSIINYQGRRFAAPASHHPAWIYQPTLNEFERLVTETGWRMERIVPFFGGERRIREAGLGLLARWRGITHPSIQQRAWQYVLLAQPA